MTRIVALAEIERALPGIDLVAEMESAFVAYSQGRVVVPPVGELLFEEPRGEMHIKYGAVEKDDVFVVKIATGFYDNPKIGLAPFGGLMLVFSAITGRPEAILLDEGHLTNVRTAAAGAVAAKHLARRDLRTIGICGSGVQARLQAEHLKGVTTCRSIVLWARDADRAAACAEDLVRGGFDVALASDPGEVARRADLIVTTTASHEPYLLAEHVRPGTHVTAMGSDTPDKIELAPELLARAQVVVADSLSQCLTRGEIHHAVSAAILDPKRVVELGDVIADPSRGRTRDDQVTIADLTGVAVQDIQISKAVCARLSRHVG